MPINHPNFIPEHVYEDAARQAAAASAGYRLVSTQDVIDGKVDGRPIWGCLYTEAITSGFGGRAVPCDFKAPLGSKEQQAHAATAHKRKLSPAERKQAERDAELRRVQPDSWPCVHCDAPMHPGEQHLCPGVKDPNRVLPHQQQVNEWQREGLKAALKELGE